LDPRAGLGGAGGAIVGPVDLEERQVQREELELVEPAARALRVHGAIPVLVVSPGDAGLENGERDPMVLMATLTGSVGGSTVLRSASRRARTPQGLELCGVRDRRADDQHS